MKIAIDATPLYNQKTGIGFYTFNLIKGMANIDDSNKIILFSKRSILKPVDNRLEQIKFEGIDNIDYKFTRIHLKMMFSAWNAVKLPTTEMYTGRVDVLHGPNYLPLPSNKGRQVVTIHDLSFILYPEYCATKTRLMFENYVPKIANKVDLIITDSYSSKKDIMERLKVSEDRIKVTHLAAGDEFRVISDSNAKESIKSKITGGYPFILFVGTLEPRKNIVRLIQAYSMIKDKLGKNYKLVLSGRKGWFYEEIFNTISTLKLENDVIVTDYVTNEELVLLYNSTDLFVYPSLYEGFGLPPLEAMACGAPVITSNSSSLPEVVGNAGITVDPCNVEELAYNMERVLFSNELKEEMVKQSLKQAGKFSWEKTARETLDGYKAILSK